MAARDNELRVFLVAGEVSGDSIASRLMASLKKVSPFPVHFAGVGGALMEKEGFRSIFPIEDIAVMGIWELLPHLNKIRIKLKEATEAAILFRPHVVVTVDSKGFSFRFLKQLKGRCMREEDGPVHVHYVAPSFWAWKGGENRLRGLCQFVDHILCILPFEEEICRLNGLAATYTGHPLLEDALKLNWKLCSLLDESKLRKLRDAFRSKHGLPHGGTVITLLPGSRLQEVKRMLPIFSQTIELLKDKFVGLSTVIPVAPNHHVETYIDREIQTWSVSPILVSGASLEQRYDAFSASNAALCTSGSAVMELQLAGLPCVVAYRAHLLTEWIIRLRTKLQFISLPNILLDSAEIPEALFQACSSENLAAILSKVILDDKVREKQIVAAEKVLRLLSSPIEKLVVSTESNNCTPSAIAASTILHSVKQQ